MRLFAFNVADLVTLFVFVVLGANIPFGALGDNLLPALAVLATLLLVARPLTVLACTLPDRRGALDAPRARVPVLDARDRRRARGAGRRAAGLGVAARRRSTRAWSRWRSSATLLLQALPAPWLAGRLGLLEPRTREVPTAAPGPKPPGRPPGQVAADGSNEGGQPPRAPGSTAGGGGTIFFGMARRISSNPLAEPAPAERRSGRPYRCR